MFYIQIYHITQLYIYIIDFFISIVFFVHFIQCVHVLNKICPKPTSTFFLNINGKIEQKAVQDTQ